MARMIAATLAKTYHTSIACDGQEGLAQALALRPDLLLCDVSMPRMIGGQLVQTLRTYADFDDMPIMVLAGRDDEQLRVELLHAGAQDYLLKPFNREELRVRVANLLSIRQARRDIELKIAAENQLATIMESTIDAIVGKTLAGVITSWNSGATALYGYSSDEVIGKSIALIFPPGRQSELPDILAVINTGGIVQRFETVRVRKDGTYLDVSVAVSPIRDAHGRITGASTIAHDITEQKKTARELLHTQSQLRAIIDASQEAMLFLNPAGWPVRVNTRFADFFGLDDTTVLSLSPWQLIAHLKERFEATASLARSLAWSISDEEHIFQEYLLQVTPTRREIDLSSLPVKDVHQSYIGRLYVWRDVTHEREVERMKSEFVSMVSHELRTPLTSIKGYIDLILTDEAVGDLTELQREFLQISLSNARRLESLVNDLLDISRLESGKIELHSEPLDLNLLISELLPSFQPGWDAKQQTFILRLPDEAPVVFGDTGRVTQILTNLLSNARKYTPAGGRIMLTVETDGAVARVAVSDSGIGLSAEEQSHLFTRFYRAQNAVTETTGGTGLGLSITRSLVELQGGQMQVESEPGRGSTFRFTLPLAQS